MQWYHLLLVAGIVLTLALSVLYSIGYRRQRDPVLRGLNAARMNISMGLLLIGLAVLQAALFKMSSLRLGLATVFALVGLFNLFAGRKNLVYYRSLRNKAA